MHESAFLKKLCILSFSVLFFWTISTSAHHRPELTPEWAMGKEGMSVARVPRVAWMQDSSAIIYNLRAPEGERTFERYDPATGKQQPMLNAAQAMVSLKSLLPSNEAKGVDWL